ncbi:MAG: NAD(P)/FAD-dependent oxidoreductase [Firmicutes bacterium]|nr:NAD(P)/FAD-dependent oxidoreductase [Bacillota bacterium]
MARIVVLGAGYAGVMAGKRLERAGQDFTLVDEHDYHQFITWLHEAAGGRHPSSDYRVPLDEIFADADHVQCVCDRVERIAIADGVVHGSRDVYAYDYLIVGVGSAPEFFGIPGMMEHSFQLDSVAAADAIRSHIEREFARGRDDEAASMRIVVGGGGLTGVEFVGELADWIPQLCARHGVNRHRAEIVILEAAPGILPMLPDKLRAATVAVLRRRGVQVRTSTAIVGVQRGRVLLAGGDTLDAGTIVWTGGVRADPLLAASGFTCDNRGRAHVTDFLQSVDDSRVYVVGDCAHFELRGRPLTPTAQAATQMGVVAATNVLATLRGRPLRRFQPHIVGTLASLGRHRGVGNVGGIEAYGSVAAAAKEFTKAKYLYQLGGLKMVSRRGVALLAQRTSHDTAARAAGATMAANEGSQGM